jgi:hypothetical protein
MYQSAQVHSRKLCSGLSGVCLLLLFAISNAKASPLAPPLLSGTLFFNLTPTVDFVDFGNYRLFQPGQTPSGADSIMEFRALGTPSPLLAGQVAASPFNLAVHLPLSPTNWRSLVLPVPFRS